MELPADSSDEAYQDCILPGVSRTFALTIPQLPGGLRRAVTNAYLLCRIADTIEDETALTAVQKQTFHRRLIGVMRGDEEAAPFARNLAPLLTESALEAERDLIENTRRIIDVSHGLNFRQREAITRCVGIMCRGMPEFQRRARPDGVSDMAQMDRYCYYVAGVVGEMLTELFCDHGPTIERQRPGLQRLAVSFGQSLQMTNILKDIWEDGERGACWLPRNVFRRFGFDLKDMPTIHDHPGF